MSNKCSYFPVYVHFFCTDRVSLSSQFIRISSAVFYLIPTAFSLIHPISFVVSTNSFCFMSPLSFLRFAERYREERIFFWNATKFDRTQAINSGNIWMEQIVDIASNIYCSQWIFWWLICPSNHVCRSQTDRWNYQYPLFHWLYIRGYNCTIIFQHSTLITNITWFMIFPTTQPILSN